MAKSKSTATPASETVISDVLRVKKGTFDVCVLGVSPLLLNRMSEKAKRELLMPKGKKSTLEKQMTLKHNPMQEFRDSPYVLEGDAPTLLAVKAASFKGAMAGAALDMPGAKKAQIGRLTYVNGELVAVYGVPKLHMDIVRMADMSRTPDVRTRACLPEWACRVSVSYVEPLIRPQAVANLLMAGGMTQGIGDGRVEKGKLAYGQFEIVTEDDPEFQRIVASGGREAQLAAMDNPECYDTETTKLLSWFEEEMETRRKAGSPAVKDEAEKKKVA